MQRKVYCKELNKTFDSLAQAAKEIGVDKSCISKCCTGKFQSVTTPTGLKLTWSYADDVQQMTAEEEIAHSINQINRQDAEWQDVIQSIMVTKQIDYYPTGKDFADCGYTNVGEAIRSNVGHEFYADYMNLDTKEIWDLKQKVFDVMDLAEIRFYPPKEAFVVNGYKQAYNTIERKWGHDCFRKMMKVLTREEYAEVKGGRK